MMEKKTVFEKALLPVYLFLEICLLIAIRMTEWQGHEGIDPDNVFMFTAIALDAAVASYYYIRYGRNRKIRHENLVFLGIILTLFADLFLSFIDTVSVDIPGIAVFCVVEAVYAVYLKSPLSSVVVRVILSIAAVIGIRFAGMFTIANALGMINLVCIAVNVYDAWRCRNHDPGMLFKIGITLFCLCDYSIMFRTLLRGIPGQIASFLVWTVYVPAIVLIACSYVQRLKPEIPASERG